jgi:hypothetical protein
MVKQSYRPTKADKRPVTPTRDPKVGIARPEQKPPMPQPVKLNKTTGNGDD